MEHVPALGTTSFRREPSRLVTSARSNWSKRSRNGHAGESLQGVSIVRTDTGTLRIIYCRNGFGGKAARRRPRALSEEVARPFHRRLGWRWHANSDLSI